MELNLHNYDFILDRLMTVLPQCHNNPYLKKSIMKYVPNIRIFHDDLVNEFETMLSFLSILEQTYLRSDEDDEDFQNAIENEINRINQRIEKIQSCLSIFSFFSFVNNDIELNKINNFRIH